MAGEDVQDRIRQQKAKAEQGKYKAQFRRASKGNTGAKASGPISGTSESAAALSEALERQAAAAAARARAESAVSSNPIAGIMDQFMSQYNSINVAPTPFEELQRIANQQVSAQFDPLINALSQEMSQKTNRANRSMGEARQMYGDLSRDFIAQIPQLTQQFAAEDQEANQRYDMAQKQLQDMYGQQSQAQNAVLQQLGIQAAAPDASRQARDDQNYFQGQMELDQQSALNALNEQQNAAQTYQRNLGDNTRVAGENTAQDISRMLEDYLGQAGSQMTGLRSQRSSALGSLLSQLQAQDAERVSKQEQQQFDNLLALSRFQMDAANSAAKNAGGQLSDMITSNYGQAQNFLGQQYQDQPRLATSLMEQLNDVLANPDVVRGKFVLDPGDPSLGKSPTYSDVGQEMMIDLLRREFEKENMAQPGRFQTGDINNAIQALMTYLGKTAR